MTLHPIAIQPHSHAHRGQHRYNPLAMGFVVLLHIGLIFAVGNGLGAKTSLPLLRDLTITVIDPPVLPPTAEPREVPPPTMVQPAPPVDIMPVLPAIEGGHNAITQQTAQLVTRPAEPAPTRVVTKPGIDARHPLTQPAYPPSSRRAGETGTVELMLYVLPSGRIGDAQVARSSGFPKLDDAALKEALRHWRLLPQREDGVAVAAWHRIAVTFRLER